MGTNIRRKTQSVTERGASASLAGKKATNVSLLNAEGIANVFHDNHSLTKR